MSDVSTMELLQSKQCVALDVKEEKQTGNTGVDSQQAAASCFKKNKQTIMEQPC